MSQTRLTQCLLSIHKHEPQRFWIQRPGLSRPTSQFMYIKPRWGRVKDWRRAHRSFVVDPCRIQPPSEPSHQNRQRHPHLQHGEPFAQAGAAPTVERDELGPRAALTVLALDLLSREPPPLRPELVGIRALRGRVAVGGVAIVADVGTLGDEDVVAENSVGVDPPVYELADGREQAQALVDDRCEARQVLLLRGLVFRAYRQHLPKDSVLGRLCPRKVSS